MTQLSITWQNIHHLGDPALHLDSVRLFHHLCNAKALKTSPVYSLIQINITNSIGLILQTNHFLTRAEKSFHQIMRGYTEVKNDFI